MKGVSAYVPCFNNSASLGNAVASLQRQSLQVDELFIIDDGSTDGSRCVAEQLGVRVIAMQYNAGRGAVRAKAMEQAQHELVLSCDATNRLPVDFMERARKWFIDPSVAAVYGRIWQEETMRLSDRWRSRHLFRMHDSIEVKHRAQLITYGCVLRREAVLYVGNFNPALRHSEDADLGLRLLAAGFDIIYDPDLLVMSSGSNRLSQVLERYWRWHAGTSEDISIYSYAKQVWYSLKVMAVSDLRAGDPLSALISLYIPHYQFLRSFKRRISAMLR